MFSYQKLSKNEGEPQDAAEEEGLAASRPNGWPTLRRSYAHGRRRWWRRRPRVRIPGLRRLAGRKARGVRAAVRKVVKRFKEGKAHIGDLFAGNYVFMQVNPSPPMGYHLYKSFAGGHGGGHPLPDPSSRHPFPLGGMIY